MVQFSTNIGEIPIWVNDIFLLNDLTGSVLRNTFYPEKFRDNVNDMSFDMKDDMVAMCHPHIAYFDDELVVALLPLSKSKMVRRVMDITLSHNISYISGGVVNSEMYKDVDSSLMNYIPDAIDIGISEKSELSTSTHIIRNSGHYTWGMTHKFI